LLFSTCVKLGTINSYAGDPADAHQEEHLLGVNQIINQPSVLEDPEKVSDAHQQFSELTATDFYNAKY
jgi:hypothetical protein